VGSRNGGGAPARLTSDRDKIGQSGWFPTCLEEPCHVPRRAFPAPVKRVLLWLGIAFVVYTVVAAPKTAAQAVTEAFGGATTVGQSVGDFFDALIS
jgi:hypothetical protein